MNKFVIGLLVSLVPFVTTSVFAMNAGDLIDPQSHESQRQNARYSFGLEGIKELQKAASPPRTFPRLPKSYRMERFAHCELGLQERSKKFLDKEEYHLWSIKQPREDILAEYDQLVHWREQIWYTNGDLVESQKEFMISQELLMNHRYRYPHLIAFQYNATDQSYNSSTVISNGLKFLALEAPSKSSIEAFFNLLHNFHVTHLVRLTPAEENGGEKSYPYWGDNVEANASTSETFINVPLVDEGTKPIAYKLRYVGVDTWKDHQSGSAEELLSIILQARKGHNPDSLIAVHCHSGVARTGTFIAGFILLNEIDRQIACGTKIKDLNLSIQKTVMQLNLQRFYMVGRPEQYVTLYRLVDLYVNRLQQ